MQNRNEVKLFLAPMEGVTDWAMRDLMTSLGGIDQCVTEFLRVTERLHPHSVFYKNCPELKTNSKTRSGTPVFIQLLGGHAEPLAENAFRAYELGAAGIDLNFGCPAKTVNRHDGGAALLKSTDRIFKIVSAVRQKIPQNTPVTAKIRLGFDDPSFCLANVQACESAGANWVTVHCRTKTDGYRPPAYWEWIPKIKDISKIKIIANGEIWTTHDFQKCHNVTSCNDFMIGRGALRNPFLFKEIKNSLGASSPTPTPEQKLKQELETIKLILPFYEACSVYVNEYFATSRTKQWLSQLRHSSEKAKNIFDQVKTYKKPIEFKDQLIKAIAL